MQRRLFGHRYSVFLSDTRGVTAIEYSLLIALIGTGAMLASTELGARLGGAFRAIGDQMPL